MRREHRSSRLGVGVGVGVGVGLALAPNPNPNPNPNRFLTSYARARGARDAAVAAGRAPPALASDDWRWGPEGELGADGDERAKVLEAKLLVRINSTPWFSQSLVKLAATSHDATWLNLEYTASKGGNRVVPCATIASVRAHDTSSWGVTKRHLVVEYFEAHGKRAGSRTTLQVS